MNDDIITNLKKHDFDYITKLGSGGFGEVVKAKHSISEQYYAIKRLKNNRHNNPNDILREIQAIASFNHPNIINYNHSFIENKELYLVMEFCSGGSLRDWLNNTGKINIEDVVDIFLTLTESFEFLHKKGYIHHDIKPDNILFSDDSIKISDFGTVNTSIGTIIYSAPEMLMSNPPVDDPRVDIFSLGLTFMECVIGENPLSSLLSWQDRILFIKNADFPIDDLPYWLQQLLLKACNYEASARFQSMQEFYDAIKNRHIPQIINQNVIDSNKITQKLKMRIVGHRWEKAKIIIDNIDDTSINFLIQKGRYYLVTNQLKRAKETFELVLIKDRSAQIEKYIAEIYLQYNLPSKAATILHGYINRHFNNIEAHNQLLYSYFLSDQWELGLEQAEYLVKLFKNEPVFINNRILFKLLLGIEIKETKYLTEFNPIGYYNYSVVSENFPKAFDNSDKQALKSKLLFHEYKFRYLHKSKNTVSVEIGKEQHNCSDHIISFGRKDYNYNTFSSFDDNNVSRRHFLIINQKNNVWLYNLNGLGTNVDGENINTKKLLLGRHEIKLGNYSIIVKPDYTKMI